MLMLLVQELYFENPTLPWLHNCTWSVSICLFLQYRFWCGTEKFFECKLCDPSILPTLGDRQGMLVDTLACQTINTRTFSLPSVGAIEHKLSVCLFVWTHWPHSKVEKALLGTQEEHHHEGMQSSERSVVRLYSVSRWHSSNLHWPPKNL